MNNVTATMLSSTKEGEALVSSLDLYLRHVGHKPQFLYVNERQGKLIRDSIARHKKLPPASINIEEWQYKTVPLKVAK